METLRVVLVFLLYFVLYKTSLCSLAVQIAEAVYFALIRCRAYTKAGRSAIINSEKRGLHCWLRWGKCMLYGAVET